MEDSELTTWKQGEKQWECSETEQGIACNYKGGKAEDNRTVLFGPDDRVRVVDSDNDVELGGMD